MTSKVTIIIQGASHSGKGTIIAAVAHKLQELGCKVVVQAAETHNKEKLEKPDEELVPRLSDVEVVIMEQRTAF